MRNHKYKQRHTIRHMNLAKTYEPNEYDKDIYDLWEKSGAFKPNLKAKDSYCIVMPPPNANADLHIGHELGMTLEDILIRYNRMLGKATLWSPGADHAGFETQVVYEKNLAKEGKSRFDFSREELFSKIWDFVENNRGNFESQFRAIGASVDWTNYTFTLDDKVVKTVYSTFKKMWDDGLIYRGERLVNYCTYHRTGFADIEVVYEDQKSPLYYFKYGRFEVATTRPETIFGDTAIAVHPDDERYKQYIGKVVKVDSVNGKHELRVVADKMVDRNFGTGVVKITPAHDFNDYDVAQRHDLPAIRVINHDGTLNHLTGKFEGLTVADGRIAVAEELKKKKLLIKVDENYKNRVGMCYKCGTIIEPMLMDQWFVDMTKLAKPAIKALKENKISFYPAAKQDQVILYLKNVKDWNISRQIAWGIPIPAFQNVDDSDDWIFDENVSEEILVKEGKTYRRDPDVFDTWFSSGHWPFVSIDYPNNAEFKRFYPNSVMETGIDILPQWVTRMICMGLYVTDEVPFKDVYLHGMVRSQDGRKMSKSIGNVINPKELLGKFGADALRMGIISGRSAGIGAAYDPSKIVAGRNFCNKLWNIARFAEHILGDDYKHQSPKPKFLADHFILQKTSIAIEKISSLIENYRFSEASEQLYHYIWDDVADWYIEASKVQLNKSVLAYVLETALKLTHPFAPFVSETIWQTLYWKGDSLLVTSPWPKATQFNTKDVNEFVQIQSIVSEIRHIYSVLNVRQLGLYYTKSHLLDKNAELIKNLSKLKGVSRVESGWGMHLTDTDTNCWLDIDREMAKNYTLKMTAQKDEFIKSIENLSTRLANKSYIDKAPKQLVDQTRQQLSEEQRKLEKIIEELDKFNISIQKA